MHSVVTGTCIRGFLVYFLPLATGCSVSGPGPGLTRDKYDTSFNGDLSRRRSGPSGAIGPFLPVLPSNLANCQVPSSLRVLSFRDLTTHPLPRSNQVVALFSHVSCLRLGVVHFERVTQTGINGSYHLHLGLITGPTIFVSIHSHRPLGEFNESSPPFHR